MSDKSLVSKAMAVVLAASVVAIPAAEAASCKVEKCYGVAAKGMNDCGNNYHGCAGQSTASRDSYDWMYVIQGTCSKIAGGSAKAVYQATTPAKK
ncbi:MAG TPA: DUF2282 domain-containing protein [Coxiellaceae bacterium]|nr:DUF2282 domain-containing protein [Coxiellaceae bacterium]